MAQTLGQTQLSLGKLPEYHLDPGGVTDWEKVKEEMRALKQVLNQSFRRSYRSLRSMQNLIQDTFDDDGKYKKQLKPVHIKDSGITSDVLHWCVKGFLTVLAFEIYLSGAIHKLRWRALPTSLSTIYIYWHTKYTNTPKSFSGGGEAVIGAAATLYVFFNPDFVGDSYAIQTTSNLTTALGANKNNVILCKSVSDFNVHPLRYCTWGGSLWRGN
jgi:hypothetical protein